MTEIFVWQWAFVFKFMIFRNVQVSQEKIHEITLNIDESHLISPLEKERKSWFDEIFFLERVFFFYFSHCVTISIQLLIAFIFFGQSHHLPSFGNYVLHLQSVHFAAILSHAFTNKKRSISVENRPRSGRFGPRSVEVGQVEKNRPTPNTSDCLREVTSRW